MLDEVRKTILKESYLKAATWVLDIGDRAVCVEMSSRLCRPPPLRKASKRVEPDKSRLRVGDQVKPQSYGSPLINAEFQISCRFILQCFLPHNRLIELASPLSILGVRRSRNRVCATPTRKASPIGNSSQANRRTLKVHAAQCLGQHRSDCGSKPLWNL